jgi:citrate lyase gamma subunit
LVVKEPIPGAKTNIAPYNHLMLKTILNSTVEDQFKSRLTDNIQSVWDNYCVNVPVAA